MSDFLNDFAKGLLRPVGGLREPGEDVSAEQFAALSKLDQTLYNFARKARGQARMSLQAHGANATRGKSRANAQRRAGVQKNTRAAGSAETQHERGTLVARR